MIESTHLCIQGCALLGQKEKKRLGNQMNCSSYWVVGRCFSISIRYCGVGENGVEIVAKVLS